MSCVMFVTQCCLDTADEKADVRHECLGRQGLLFDAHSTHPSTTMSVSSCQVAQDGPQPTAAVAS